MPNERRVLFWMCVLVGVNQLGFGAVVPTISIYAHSFGVSNFEIGLTIAIYGLARFAVAAPSGRMCDRLGRSPTLVIGGIATALGNLWCGLASSYPEFVIARFVAGAGAGLIITGGQVVLADITTPERRGRVLAIYQGVFIFAVGIGPFPGGLLADHLGLAAPFFAYAAAGILATGLAWFAVSETRELARARTKGGIGLETSYMTQVRMLARQTGYDLVCLIALVNAVARTGGLFSIIPVYATLLLNLSGTEIGLAMAVGSVVGVLAAYPAGALADRFGRKAVIVPATLISGASFLLFCFAPTYLWFAAACLVWSLASSIGGAAPATYAADCAPPGLNATTMSLYRMAGDAGYVAGPLALGAVADAFGPEVALIISAAILLLIGIVFAVAAPETLRRRR